MDISLWVLASVGCKLILYTAAALANGGVLSALLVVVCQTTRQRAATASLTAAILLGMVASGLNFLVQVGNFADTGLTGMVDPTLAGMLWQSQVGDLVIVQIASLATSLVAVALLAGAAQRPPGCDRRLRLALAALFAAAGAAAMSWGFSLVGHSVDHGLTGAVAIAIHTFAVSWWMGSLHPLWRATHTLEPPALYRAMHLFGVVAGAVVALVLLSGSVLLWLMTDSLLDLLTTAHGRLLAVKLLLVVGILLLAARHKWRMVPALVGGAAAVAPLRRSLVLEIAIAAAILAATAVLSTAVSPPMAG